MRLVLALFWAGTVSGAWGGPPPESAPAEAPPPTDWRAAERGILEHQVQLTHSDRFVKAGEAYFSTDGARIVFQAIEAKPDGEADEIYAMFVADVTRNAEGRITGLEAVRRISPPGSANTCGWFDPDDSGRVLFATTIGPPTESSPPGYQRSTGRYRWMFPPEMRIVSCDLDTAYGSADSLTPLVGDGDAYVAEGSLSADGRTLVYCSLQSNQGDLFVRDLRTGRTACVVKSPGYDGGPFFSPDGGRRLCYRSDRAGDHLLQLFVADLALDDNGDLTAIREYQLTNNEHVNWCPFWHPDGRHLVYATSEISHHNYEIFLVDADPGDLAGSAGPIRYGTGKRRVTFADGSDVLPVFSADGKVMMWTSRRGPDGSVQLWAADFVMDLDGGTPADEPREGH